MRNGMFLAIVAAASTVSGAAIAAEQPKEIISSMCQKVLSGTDSDDIPPPRRIGVPT